MKLKTVVKLHLGRELIDLLLTTLLPFAVMVESAYANGWAFAGGDSGISLTSINMYLSLLRGLVLEVLIFAMFLLVRHSLLKKQWYMAVVPSLIGVVTMLVSAALNIGWANHSGEMSGIVANVNDFLPAVFLSIFKAGLGLSFPVAVAAFALYDTFHLFHETVEKSDRASGLVLAVENADMHRSLLQRKQKESLKDVEHQYEQMARIDAQNMVNRVKQGDYSFGVRDAIRDTQSLPQLPAVVRVTPMPQLPPAQSLSQPLSTPNVVTGQFRSFPQGNGQNSQLPLMPTMPLNQVP